MSEPQSESRSPDWPIWHPGPNLAIEAQYPNGRGVTPFRIFLATEDPTAELVALDEGRLQSVDERKAIIARLPAELDDELRTEVDGLLLLVANDVAGRAPQPKTDAKAQQGASIILTDAEPSESPVNGSGLLDAIETELRRYVVLDESARKAVALWVLFTYVHDAGDTSPNLALVSPTKRCGKTTLLGILSALVRRPLPSSNASPSALFRAIGKHAPTILLDEMDTLFQTQDDRADLRGLLNSGHTHPTASMLRSVGDTFEPQSFSTWCPKIFAKIGELPDTLTDRSVIIPMKRKLPSEKVARMRFARLHGQFESLRRQATRWAKDHLEALQGAEPDVPGELNDRAADNWRPLLAIADLAGGDWPSDGRKAALVLSGEIADDTGGPAEQQILSDLRTYCEKHTEPHFPSADLVSWLRGLDDRPWATWGRGTGGLTARHLAKLLRPFGVGPKSVRTSGAETPKGYSRDELRAVCLRYLPSYPQHPQRANETTTYGTFPSATQPDLLRIENGAKSLGGNEVADVADRSPLLAGVDGNSLPEEPGF